MAAAPSGSSAQDVDRIVTKNESGQRLKLPVDQLLQIPDLIVTKIQMNQGGTRAEIREQSIIKRVK